MHKSSIWKEALYDKAKKSSFAIYISNLFDITDSFKVYSFLSEFTIYNENVLLVFGEGAEDIKIIYFYFAKIIF